MKNFLMETTGAFMLSDIGNAGFVIEAHRPVVSLNTNFVQARVALGQIRLLGEVTLEATDEEFMNYLKDSDNDPELATSSFLESFKLVETTQKISGRKKVNAVESKPTE